MLRSRECGNSLDADVTVQWQGYGKNGTIPGMLQMQAPSLLRFSVVDPLGRQHFILVSDGDTFTLINNSRSTAYAGPADSPFLRRYIPACISPHHYHDWLTGRLPFGEGSFKHFRWDAESPEAVWLITGWEDGVRHHVLFAPESATIKQHLVEGEDGGVLLDVVYDDYQANELDCLLPHLLRIEGATISGTALVRYDKIFPVREIPERHFQIVIPDHFTVETVE